MSHDLDADKIRHCHMGAQRLVAVRQSTGDLMRLAKRASGYTRAAEGAQRQVPDIKAALERNREQYRQHITECDECQPRTVEVA